MRKPGIKTTALLGVLLCLPALLTGCDSTVARAEIKADALFSGAVLALPVNCRVSTGIYVNYGVSVYTSNQSYMAQSDIVAEACGAEHVREYADYDSGSRLHIHLPGEDGRADDYYLALYPQSGDGKRFVFSGMGAEVAYDPETSAGLLLPYHLISDTRITRSVAAKLYAGAEYETCARTDESGVTAEEGGYSLEKRLTEFYEFYRATGWYDAALRGDDAFTITKDGQTFTFAFAEHAGQVFFAVS